MTTAVSVLPMEDARPLGAVTDFDDSDSEAWLAALRATGPERDEAVARLHELLLKAARFEVGRRRAALPHLRGDDFDDLAVQSADDALVAILKKLDDFRGDSRFTTWAYKFALLEAAVKLRKRAWQGREVPLEPETWEIFHADGLLARAVGRAERALPRAPGRHRDRADAAPARGAGGARAERRADRRPRGAARHQPRRAVQDAARRT